MDFQRMLYTESLAYTQPSALIKGYLSVFELQQIAAISGHKFLSELDRYLTPASLAILSKGVMQSLFLMTFGTILAVGYAPPLTESPIFPSENISRHVNC